MISVCFICRNFLFHCFLQSIEKERIIISFFSSQFYFICCVLFIWFLQKLHLCPKMHFEVSEHKAVFYNNKISTSFVVYIEVSPIVTVHVFLETRFFVVCHSQ